jgi:hypothetical protein
MVSQDCGGELIELSKRRWLPAQGLPSDRSRLNP